MSRKLRYALLILGVPAVIAVGAALLSFQKYNLLSLMAACLILAVFLAENERKPQDVRKMVLVAVLSAISALSRIVFAAIPHFKPVAAIVIVTGMSLGPEAGFLTGALSALVSNMYFGQGPWTPFQMFAWGIAGFFAGVLRSRGGLKSTLSICVYGAAAGIFFSLILDLWTVLSIDNSLNPGRYLAVTAAALPIMAEYAASNVIFLLLLKKPFETLFGRIKQKYGIV